MGVGLIISVMLRIEGSARDEICGVVVQSRRLRPAQRVFISVAHWSPKSLQIISGFILTAKVEIRARQAQSDDTPTLPLSSEQNGLFYTAQLLSFIKQRRRLFIFINSLQESYGPADTRGCMDQITSAILDSLTLGRRAKCCWMACTCSSCLRDGRKEQ